MSKGMELPVASSPELTENRLKSYLSSHVLPQLEELQSDLHNLSTLLNMEQISIDQDLSDVCTYKMNLLDFKFAHTVVELRQAFEIF